MAKGKPPEAQKWKKGQSGNPKGRPRKIPELKILLANVLGDEVNGLTAAEIILTALRKKAEKGDVRAAELLLDRAYGKARSEVEMSGFVSTVIMPLPPGS
jgi:hypothetical protein